MSDGAHDKLQWTAVYTLPPQDEAMAQVERELLDGLAARGFDDAAVFAVKLGFQEALVNAFVHGNRHDPAKTVDVRYRLEPDRVIIEVEDRGKGFDPSVVPDPTIEENLTKPTGRGILLMRAFMSNIEYLPPGNRVRMTYTRPGASGDSEASSSAGATSS